MISYCQIQTEIEQSGENTRPFRYNLNQIPYDYTVESDKQIQGIRFDRQSAWRTVDGGSWHFIGGSDQAISKKKKCKKAK